jgi:hypothetical protein
MKLFPLLFFFTDLSSDPYPDLTDHDSTRATAIAYEHDFFYTQGIMAKSVNSIIKSIRDQRANICEVRLGNPIILKVGKDGDPDPDQQIIADRYGSRKPKSSGSERIRIRNTDPPPPSFQYTLLFYSSRTFLPFF